MKLKDYRERLEKFPINLNYTKLRGRFVVAKNDISPGDLLLAEYPTAYSIFYKNSQEYCQSCINPIKYKSPEKEGWLHSKTIGKDIITCTDCRNQCFWCSEYCKKNDLIHNLTCQIIVELPGIAGSTGADYNLVRLIINLIATKHLENEIETKGTPSAFVDVLVSHMKHSNPEFIQTMKLVGVEIFELLEKNHKLNIKPSPDEIVKLACRINSNSHMVTDTLSSSAIGVGMFPLMAMINHSCSPNAGFSTNSRGQVFVRALKPIALGEEICLSYVDLFSPKWERRGTLLKTKHFWCNCNRCEPNTAYDSDKEIDALKCNICKSGIVVQNEDDWSCLNCQTKFMENEIAEIMKKVDTQDAKDLFSAGLLDSAQCAMEDCLRRAESLLSENHYLKLDIYMSLITICCKQNRLVLASEYNKRALEIMKNIARAAKLGDYVVEMANLHEKHGEILEIISEAVKQRLIQYDLDADDILRMAREEYSKCQNIRTILGIN